MNGNVTPTLVTLREAPESTSFGRCVTFRRHGATSFSTTYEDARGSLSRGGTSSRIIMHYYGLPWIYFRTQWYQRKATSQPLQPCVIHMLTRCRRPLGRGGCHAMPGETLRLHELVSLEKRACWPCRSCVCSMTRSHLGRSQTRPWQGLDKAWTSGAQNILQIIRLSLHGRLRLAAKV